jgi:hypothetical protein
MTWTKPFTRRSVADETPPRAADDEGLPTPQVPQEDGRVAGETGAAALLRVRAGAPGVEVRGRQGLRPRLLRTWWSLPGWGQALAVYAVSRLIDFLIISRVARFQVPSLWNGPDPGYLGVVSLWDGDWYRRIAEFGYPSTLPIDRFGHVAQSQWAFYPVYPYTARFVGWLLGTGWPVSASIVSIGAGALAVMVMRSLVESLAGRELGLWTVVLFCAFPAAPVLQLAYTESVSMLLLVAALWCLRRRRYLLAAPVVLLLGLARPIGVPVAAVVALHVIYRLRRRRLDPVTPSTVASLAVLGAAALLAAVEWTLIAAAVTGRPDAYAQTMGAWRTGHELTPFRPWWTMSQYFLGDWVGPAVVAAGAGLAVWVLTRRLARVVGPDLRNWMACYLAYLAAVLDPSTSLARYLLPLFPFGTMLAAASRSAAYRRTLVLAFLGGQILWVAWLWRFSPPTDWPP